MRTTAQTRGGNSSSRTSETGFALVVTTRTK